jgi:formylglycine-generating enzyme required for sulfatase activity
MISFKMKWCLLILWLFVIFTPGRSVVASENPIADMEFVFIKGGCFQMGSEQGAINERPVHTACVSDFFMGKFEVTQGQWKSVMGNNPSFFDNCGDDCPVENVSWVETQAFIRRLNQMTGTNKYRLPTEAEWEYAARSGSQTTYSFGDDAGDLDVYGWYDGNSGTSQPLKEFYNNERIRTSPHPVGRKKPNKFGLYDMHGNVWEWVYDWYGDYSPDRIQDSTGPSSGSDRVFRGGSWHDNAGSSRSAKRFASHPLSSMGERGFRLVRTP